MTLYKIITAFVFVLAVSSSSTIAAESKSDLPCGVQEIEVGGVKKQVTSTNFGMCPENVISTIRNETVNEKDIDPKLYNAFSEGGTRMSNSTKSADTLKASKDSITYIIAFICFVLFVVCFVGYFVDNSNGGDANGKKNWRNAKAAISACIGFALSFSLTNTNLNYLAMSYFGALATYTANKIDYEADLAAINKDPLQKFSSIKNINNSNNLTAIAMQDIITTRYVDTLAFGSFSKDYASKSYTSIFENALTLQDFISRITACNVIKPNYILTNDNSVYKFVFGGLTQNTSIKFAHVTKCSGEKYMYRDNVYGYTDSSLGEINFPTLEPESKYFTSKNYSDNQSTIENFIESKTKYSPQFSNNGLNAFRGSNVYSEITKKVNDGVAIDIASLRNESIMRSMYAQCKQSSLDEIKSLSGTLNKSKAAIYYQVMMECRDAFYGKNKDGINSTTELYKSALKQAANIIRQYCPLKENGQRIASQVNSISSTPFTDESGKMSTLNVECFSFEKNGLVFNGATTPRDIVEAQKIVLTENNLVASYLDHVELGLALELHDYYMQNETDLTVDDKAKYGPVMRLTRLLITDSNNASDMYDSAADISPSIVSKHPWNSPSNYLNWSVVSEKNNPAQEALAAVSLQSYRLGKHLNNGGSTISGVETPLQDFKSDENEIDPSVIIKYIETALTSGSTTSTNMMKGMNGSENIIRRLSECSVLRNKLCFNGSNTFVMAFRGNTESISFSIQMFVGLYAISKVGDLVDGVADGASQMIGGVLGDIFNNVIKFGGKMAKIVFTICGLLSEVYYYMLLAQVLLAGFIIYVIIESILLFVNFLIWIYFSFIRLSIAYVVGAFKKDNTGHEMFSRSGLLITYSACFAAAFPNLFMSLYTIVDAILWAALCDIFLMVKSKMNAVLGLLFGQTIYVLIPLQSSLTIIVILKMLKGIDASIRYIISPQEAQYTHHDTMSTAAAAATGAYVRDEAAKKVQDLKSKINMYKKR